MVQQQEMPTATINFTAMLNVKKKGEGNEMECVLGIRI